MDESLTVRRGTELAGADPALRDRVVQSLERCRAGLKQAVTCREYKILSDIADAQAIFAARQRLGDDVIGYAHAVKIDALAALGKLLAEQPRAEGGRPRKTSPPSVQVSGLTLAEMGIDRKTSALSQRLAALSDSERAAVASREKTLAEVSRETTAAVRSVRLALPDAKYRVIYVDPPWRYRDKADAGAVQSGGVERHYPTMSIAELCALDIKGIADRDAVLFLWVTSPLLFECAPVITAWGFEYKASIVWNKDAHNMGHYVSVRHEFLLICTRGSATPDMTERLHSVVTEKRTTHSTKPERFREMIDAMYTHGKRIELFARTAPPAPWAAYGDEVLPR